MCAVGPPSGLLVHKVSSGVLDLCAKFQQQFPSLYYQLLISPSNKPYIWIRGDGAEKPVKHRQRLYN